MQKNTVYQVSTAQYLISGNAEGHNNLNKITRYGDFGIGAINHYNGEMIVCNKKVFIANYYGNVKKVTDSDLSPFYIITPFEPDKEYSIRNSNQEKTFELLTEKFLSADLIYAIKITGKFDSVLLRSGKEQQKPYPDFKQIIENSNTYKKENISGTMIGFYFPEPFEKVSTSHFHFHFIDNEETIGGHVCNFYINDAKAYLNEKANLNIVLPKPET